MTESVTETEIAEAVEFLTNVGYTLLPPLQNTVVTYTMCPGCGHNRAVTLDGGFYPHTRDFDGVSGAECDRGIPEGIVEAEIVNDEDSEPEAVE